MATVDIELYYDIDRRRWTTSAGGLAAQPSLFIGQSNTIDFKVRFVQGGVPIELTNPSFIAGVKVTDDPLGDYLLLTTTGTKTGAGATTIYTFTLNIDSVELQAYLLGITPTTNSTAFEVRDTVNNIATLPAITCSILPDYTLTGATPVAGSGTLVVDSGATFTVHKSFAMPTTDGVDTYVLKTNGAGVGRWAVDSAGTGTVTSVAVTTANGVSGSVATPTTTPAITLTLGAITPTTGAFSDETEATSSTSASLKTAGGMAVARALYVGEFINVMGNSDRSTFVNEVIIYGALLVANINSFNNDPILHFSPIANSVNYLTIEPSVTGSPVHIYASSTTDTNVGLHLSPKGTGFVNVEDGNDTTKRLRFSASGNGTGIITTLASSSTTSQTITLPNATTTLAGLDNTAAFTNKTYNGHTLTAGSSTFTGTAAQTYTFPTTSTTIAGLSIAQTFTASQTLNTTTADNTGLITIKFNGTTKGLIGYRTTDLAGLQITGPAGSGGFQITDSQTRWFTNGSASATATLADGVGLSITGAGNGRNFSVAGATTLTGLLTANGGVTVASGQVLKLGNAATTGLTPGVLAATTNATITITDSTGQVYRIPCII